MSKHTEDGIWVSQTSSVKIYVYRVYMYVYLYTFHKINWLYAPNHNYFAIILLFLEDELSLYATKLFRNNNKSFIRMYTRKCNLRYAHRRPDIRFGSDLVRCIFHLIYSSYTLLQKIPEYVTKDTYVFKIKNLDEYIYIHVRWKYIKTCRKSHENMIQM